MDNLRINLYGAQQILAKKEVSMRTLGKLLALAGLLLTLIPIFLMLLDFISYDDNKNLMLIGTVLWFIVAPLIIRKDQVQD